MLLYLWWRYEQTVPEDHPPSLLSYTCEAQKCGPQTAHSHDPWAQKRTWVSPDDIYSQSSRSGVPASDHPQYGPARFREFKSSLIGGEVKC